MKLGFAPRCEHWPGRPGSLPEGVAEDMGVMLALDRPGAADRPGGGRGRRQGQHVRSGDQARADPLTVQLSYDLSCAGRSLSRLARLVLAGQRRLAAAGWPPARAGRLRA